MGSAFLDVARRVTHPLRPTFTHENVGTQRRQHPSRREFHPLFVGREVFVSGFLDDDILEASGYQQGACFGWRNQEGAAAIHRPRQGKMGISNAPQAMF